MENTYTDMLLTPHYLRQHATPRPSQHLVEKKRGASGKTVDALLSTLMGALVLRFPFNHSISLSRNQGNRR